MPKGLGWTWLVVWLVENANSLPTALIPDVSKVFQAWLISTQHQLLPFNAVYAAIVGRLFEWLALIEDAMTPRMFRDIRDAPPSLNIRHLSDVRDEIRMTAFAFGHLNPQRPNATSPGSIPTAFGIMKCMPSCALRADLPEPRPRRSRILRWARSSRKKTPTTV